MPTKHLLSRPNIEHLKHQAKDLIKGRSAGDIQACQRIREFHPRFTGKADSAIRAATFTLSDAHLTIAREYGFSSWARLSAHVNHAERSKLDRPHHGRIEDAHFRRAVDLLDDGDVDGLRNHLRNHPAWSDSASFSKGRTTSEIDLLCDYGADPDGTMVSALGHGEFDAVDALIRPGATVDLSTAAATGRIEDVRRSVTTASADQRHRALAWAAQYGHAEIVRLLLDAGEDPNRYNPERIHSHSTPLHQAALAGHVDVVRVLLEHGARADIKDIHYQGTPLEWAEYAGRAKVVEFLRSRTRGTF